MGQGWDYGLRDKGRGMGLWNNGMVHGMGERHLGIGQRQGAGAWDKAWAKGIVAWGRSIGQGRGKRTWDNDMGKGMG